MSRGKSEPGGSLSGGGITVGQDPWLSNVMARPVSRLSGCVNQGAESKAEVTVGQGIRNTGFSYARVATSDICTCQLLERCGFRIVDTGVTMELTGRSLPGAEHVDVRLAQTTDQEAVEEVARTSFSYSRFHLDPDIPKSLANDIKAQWAGNFFRGLRGDHMVVAQQDGGVVGFLQLLAVPDYGLTIDLIAVDTRYRRQGIAKAMMSFAYQECGQPSIIRLGTQIANLVSLGLYQQLGFRIVSTDYMFHLHRLFPE